MIVDWQIRGVIGFKRQTIKIWMTFAY